MDDFDTLNMYFGIYDEHSRIYQLPEGLLKSIALDIARYFFNRYCTIVEFIKPIRGYRHVGKSEKPTGERKVSSDEIWESYRAQLKHMHSLLYGRRAKIEFTLRLIKKALCCGWECVRAGRVGFIGNITSDARPRLGWVKDEERLSEAAVRIFKEGVDKFFERSRPFLFYPSTKKLAEFLMEYCLDNMPVKIPPELEKMDRDSAKEEYDLWYTVAYWRNNAIEKFVETVCKKYKKHVPLLCRAKFPEWAVKWVYEETVLMKKEEG